MKLVPAGREEPEIEKLNELDKQMYLILKNKKLTNLEKVRLYHQILMKNINAEARLKQKPVVVDSGVDISEQERNVEDPTESSFLSTINNDYEFNDASDIGNSYIVSQPKIEVEKNDEEEKKLEIKSEELKTPTRKPDEIHVFDPNNIFKDSQAKRRYQLGQLYVNELQKLRGLEKDKVNVESSKYITKRRSPVKKKPKWSSYYNTPMGHTPRKKFFSPKGPQTRHQQLQNGMIDHENLYN